MKRYNATPWTFKNGNTETSKDEEILVTWSYDLGYEALIEIPESRMESGI